MILQIILCLLLIIILLFLICFIKKKFVTKKQYKDFLKIFGSMKTSMPSLQLGSTYWWPTFKVTFNTKEDFEYAKKNKLFEEFKKQISLYYDERFNSEMATEFTYDEA